MNTLAFRFQLRSLLFTMAVVAFPLGLTKAFGVNAGFLLCIAFTIVLLVVLKKWTVGVILLFYVTAFILFYAIAIYDTVNYHPT